MNRNPETDTEVMCKIHGTPMKRYRNGIRYITFGPRPKREKIIEYRFSFICTKCNWENKKRNKLKNLSENLEK